MFIAMYVSLVAVFILLRHQERRHIADFSLLCQRLGKTPPLREPKLLKYESWLTLPVGIFISAFGILSIYTNFSIRMIGMRPTMEEWIYSCVFLALGITVYVLGVRSLEENKKYERMVKERQQG